MESGPHISILGSVDDLRGAAPAIQALAENALSPNILYEPWMLIPAWEALTPKARQVQMILVLDAAEQAIGLFPLETKHRLRWLPIKHHQLWKHIHCFLCDPLLRRGCEQAALTAFFGWYRTWTSRGACIAMRAISGTGPLPQALSTAAASERLRAFETTRWERALLQSRLPSEDYLAQAISGKKLKEYRRQLKRLGEQGDLQMSVMTGNDSIGAWVADFLALERMGWKGQSGSALAMSEGHSIFFAKILRSAFALDRLLMLKFALNGRPIAMKCSFKAREGAFAFKIAYDEAFARFSPGVLLELENMRHILDHTDLQWMDSCADPNHPMIDHLWRERKQMANWLIGSGPWRFKPLFAIITRAER